MVISVAVSDIFLKTYLCMYIHERVSFSSNRVSFCLKCPNPHISNVRIFKFPIVFMPFILVKMISLKVGEHLFSVIVCRKVKN